MTNHLIVMALDMESRGRFQHLPVVHTGLGKVNAALRLSRAIHESRPTHIINLGTAGSQKFNTRELVYCRNFIQRDMDVTPLGFKPYQTPFDGSEPLLAYGEVVDFLPEAICGTGDSFDTSSQFVDYDIVDMEAFAYAKVAQAYQIPFTCIKFISDGADHAASDGWEATLEEGAEALLSVYQRWEESHLFQHVNIAADHA